MLTIEIAGWSGSGKSTITRELDAYARRNQLPIYTVNRLAAERIPSRGIVDRALAAARRFGPARRRHEHRQRQRLFDALGPMETLAYLREHPTYMPQLVAWAERTKATEAQRRQAIEHCLEVIGIWHVANSLLEPDEIFFWEERAILWAGQFIAIHEPAKVRDWEVTIEILDTVPLPDIYVNIELPPETCLARLKERSKVLPPFYRGMTDTDILDFYRRSTTNQKRFHHELSKRGVHVIAFDNSAERPGTEQSEELLRCVAKSIPSFADAQSFSLSSAVLHNRHAGG